MKNLSFLFRILIIFSLLILSNINTFSASEIDCLAPNHANSDKLISEYKENNFQDFGFFKKSDSSSLTTFLRRSCSVVVALAVITTLTVTNFVSPLKARSSELNRSNIEQIQATNISQVFSSGSFSVFLNNFFNRDIRSLNDTNLQNILSEIGSFNQELRNDFEGIVNYIIKYNDTFFENYSGYLNLRNKSNKILSQYINDVKSGEKELLDTSDLTKWRIICEEYSATDLTDFEVGRVHRRHKQILETIDKKFFSKLYERWVNSVELWIENDLFINLSHKGNKLYLTPYKVITKNSYEFNNEQFYSLRIKSLNRTFINYNIGGMNIRGINHIFIMDESGEFATKQIRTILQDKYVSQEKVFFENFDGKKIRRLDLAMRKVIHSRFENKIDLNIFSFNYYNSIKSHELQHKVNNVFSDINREIDEDKMLFQEEYSGYIAGIAKSEIPFWNLMELIPMLFAEGGSSEQRVMISVFANIFKDIIKLHPIKEISFTSDELNKISDLNFEEDNSIELSLKIINFMERIDDDTLKSIAYKLHKLKTGRDIHEGLQVIDDEQYRVFTPAITTQLESAS